MFSLYEADYNNGIYGVVCEDNSIKYITHEQLMSALRKGVIIQGIDYEMVNLVNLGKRR